MQSEFQETQQLLSIIDSGRRYDRPPEAGGTSHARGKSVPLQSAFGFGQPQPSESTAGTRRGKQMSDAAKQLALLPRVNEEEVAARL